MTRGWFSIVLACASGAGIGALTALEISTRFAYGSYLWVIDDVGGTTAYIINDFHHFCDGVIYSYRKTIDWRPDTLWWKAFVTLTAGMMMLFCSLFISVAMFVSYNTNDPIPPSTYLRMVMVLSVPSGFISLIVVSLAQFICYKNIEAKKEDFGKIIKAGQISFFFVNPIGMILLFSILLLMGLGWLAVHTPTAISKAAPATIDGLQRGGHTIAQFAINFTKFVAEAFIYVHTQRRTICFVDATIGATIGYSFGSAIIGAIAGATLGILNYEVVSVRLLRLAPR